METETGRLVGRGVGGKVGGCSTCSGETLRDDAAAATVWLACRVADTRCRQAVNDPDAIELFSEETRVS